MSAIKRKPGKYPYNPTKEEMDAVDMFNESIKSLKEYLEIENDDLTETKEEE